MFTTSTEEMSCEEFDVFAIEALKRSRAGLGVNRGKCRSCGLPFEAESVMGYSHSDGWYVPAVGRFWLYLTCEKCGYKMALWKLGLPRDWTPEGEGE